MSLISSNVVLDPDRLAREVEFFGNAGEMVFDVETIPSSAAVDDRGVPCRNQVLWVGLATHGRAIQVPMGHPLGTQVTGWTKEPRTDKNGKVRMFRVPVYERAPEQMTRADAFPLLNKLFSDPGVIKAAHGATFDNATVAKYRGGLIPAGKLPCTLTMRWLTDENRHRYGLKYITKDIYKFNYDDEDVGRRVEKYPFRKVAHYLHCDVKFAWLEYLSNKERIAEQGLQDLYELETDLVSVLSHMRTTGVRIDTDRLEELREELEVRVGQIERQVYTAAGRQFNLNAARQKQEVLYLPKSEGGQDLKPWKLTDGGRDKVERQGLTPDHTFYSTDEESLDGFRGNPVVDALLHYQETNKVLGTYVHGYLGIEGNKDHPSRVFGSRVYPDFVQYGTKTGRFSCRDPNLQNVPRPSTDLGKLVRGLFVADDGWKLIVADYGQIELVILAHFIGHGSLFDGFWNGIDPHTTAASRTLGKPPEDVTKDERQLFGKSNNFATVYGAGVKKLAAMMGVSVEQARKFKRVYSESSPEIDRYRNKVIREARRHSPPHVTTILGRKRTIPQVNSADDGLRMYAERQLFNAEIQGSSADLTKLAMVRFFRRRKPHWQILLTVHDEIVVTAPAHEAEECRALLVECMIGDIMQDMISVPLTVDAKICNRWSEAK